MLTATAIPVTVTPEAAARVAELGMEREFEAMVERARETLTGLRKLEVILDYAPWMSPEPAILLQAFRHMSSEVLDRTNWDWISWMTEAFPSEVCQHFVMLSNYE